MRTSTSNKSLLIVSAAGITLSVAVALFMQTRDANGHALVNQLFEIAGPPDVAEDAELAPTRPAVPAGERAIKGLPSDQPSDIEDVLAKGIPSSVRTPFIGTWVERSVGESVITTLTTEFTRSGAFASTALVRSREIGGESVRIVTSGRWTMDGEDLVMAVDETSHPEIVPVGFVQTCAGSRVDGGDWTYADPDGTARLARRK